ERADRVEFKYRLQNGVEIRKVIVLDPDRHTLQMTLMFDNKNPVPEGKSEPADVEMRREIVAFNGMDPDSLYRYESYLMGVCRYDRGPKLVALPQVDK